MHVERRAQLLCMLYESVTRSLPLALPPVPLPRLPIIHSSFYGRKEREAWQVNAVKSRDKLCVCVRPPSLKRTERRVEIDACWSALPPRGGRMEGSSEEDRKCRVLGGVSQLNFM